MLGLVLSLGIYILPANSQLTYFPENTIKVAQEAQLTTNTQELLQQGKIFYQSGQFSLATQTLKQAAQVYQSQKDVLNQVLALNYLALTEQKLGNWQQASEHIKNSRNLLSGLKLNSDRAKRIFALTLNTQGHLQLKQ